jgi:hypothetical protein
MERQTKMKTVHHIRDADGFSTGRVSVSDSEQSPVYISLGVDAYMGTYLTTKEAQDLINAINQTLKELS